MNDLSPYAGRWVALIGEQVVGIGNTAEEAFQSAQHHRAKERAVVAYIESEDGERLSLPSILDELKDWLKPFMPVYLVGGAVRDALLGRNSTDLDFIVEKDGIALANLVGNKLNAAAYPLDEERDTGRVVLPEGEAYLDFACFRGPDLAADLRARDFTINALAIPATARTRTAVIDPTGGLPDMESRRIRMIEEGALTSDPVRTLRAVRLAATLDFTITEETRLAVIAAGPLLADVSAERKRDEIVKIVMAPHPDQAMLELEELGLLKIVLPEVAGLSGVIQSPPHYEDVISHTWTVLRWLVRLEAVPYEITEEDWVPAEAHSLLRLYSDQLRQHLDRPVDGGVNGHLLLRLSALFHDVGKQQTYEIDENGRIRFLGHAEVGAAIAGSALKQLCFSRDAVKQVKRIVAGHMRPLLLAKDQGSSPSRKAVYRYFRALDQNGLDVALLALADHLATHNGPGDLADWDALAGLIAQLFRFYFEQHEETIRPAPLLNGRDLIEQFGIAPGPEIGRILRLIEEGQAAGEISTRQEALQFAQEQLL